MTSDVDRALLLEIAREAIAAHVNRQSQSQSQSQSAIRNPQSAILTRPGAVFVTIHKRGDLRGCIGQVESTEPLGQIVPRIAVAASSADPRFPPLSPDELNDVDLEISLLGPLIPIAGPQDIVVGRDGLVVEQGWHRGLLLPQVATEWKWDAETFLDHTCQKAGLPKDAWRRGAAMWRFEAEVFGEGRWGGPIPPLRSPRARAGC
jgi:AmmeMemoRadiSam system protein A